ncbi:MAG: hypothetical protein ACTHJW_01680 [Streptosporangiaceae bacterium]
MQDTPARPVQVWAVDGGQLAASFLFEQCDVQGVQAEVRLVLLKLGLNLGKGRELMRSWPSLTR